MSDLPLVGVYGLGGTIASSPSGDGGVTPQFGIDTLVEAVPDIQSLAELRLVDLVPRPSAELSLDDVVRLACRIRADYEQGVHGFVICQGTDTLEECAFGLDTIWDAPAPVVITGAMRPPGAAGADGPANLRAAVVVAASPALAGAGVLVVMNDEVHAARRVRKMHSSSPAAFRSPDGGCLAQVTEGRVEVWARPPRSRAIALPDDPRPQPPVALVRVALGDDERCLAGLLSSGYEGVVVEGMGGGHVPGRLADPLARIAERLPVVLASRTGAGELLRETYSFPGSEIDLRERGVIFAGSLDGLKARVKLSLLLMAGVSLERIRAAFEQPEDEPLPAVDGHGPLARLDEAGPAEAAPARPAAAAPARPAAGAAAPAQPDIADPGR